MKPLLAIALVFLPLAAHGEILLQGALDALELSVAFVKADAPGAP